MIRIDLLANRFKYFVRRHHTRFGSLATTLKRSVREYHYDKQLKELLRDGAAKSPHELFAEVDDEFWLWMLTEGCRRNPALQAILPSMPEERVQLQSNGISGDHALRDAWVFYKLMKELYRKHVGNLSDSKAIVDFGVGWARMIRFFLKDVEPQTLLGIDHYDKVIEVSKQTCKWGNFQLIAPFPPTAIPDASVDLVYCYSVFSHLSEDAHLKWLSEFSRILRPGGLLIATTWSTDFLLRCRDARADTKSAFWTTHLPRIFVDTDMWLAHYKNGGYCYETDVAQYGDVAHYLGETAIPKAYVQRHWTQFLQFVDFIDDHAATPQNVIVMKK
jgi:SAM-dependent methyltransferase